MNIFFEATTWLSKLLRPHTSQIAVGFVATILVVFGNDMSRSVKELIKNFHFIFRLIFLILVCAVGYTLLTDWSNRLVKDFLLSMPGRWYSVVVIGAFIGMGILAERKKYM